MSEDKKKIFLFDWDGVLARRTDFVPIWDCLQKEFGVNPENTKAALRKVDSAYQKGEISNDQFWASICQDIGLTGATTEYLNNLFFSPREINQKLLTAIGELREKSYVGVVSNNFDVMRTKIEHEFGMHFDLLLFSCDTGYVKPSVEPFRLASERLKRKLSEIVFVDDDRRNLDMLVGEGIRVVNFKWESPDTTSYLIKQLHGYNND